MSELIKMKEVTKVYPLGETEVQALRGVDVSIKKGEFISIIGPSGSGKSTLMHIIGCLDTATSRYKKRIYRICFSGFLPFAGCACMVQCFPTNDLQ